MEAKQLFRERKTDYLLAGSKPAGRKIEKTRDLGMILGRASFRGNDWGGSPPAPPGVKPTLF